MKLANDFGVRALFGTLIITPSMAALLYLVVNGADNALSVMTGLTGAVVGFYFGQRGNN